MVISNQPQEVVQDHQQGPHVPVLCGLKGYRSENCTTSIILPKDFNGDAKSAPRSFQECTGGIFRTVALQTTENWDMGSLLEVLNNFLGLI